MRRVPDKNHNLPEDELRGITAELIDALDRLVKARVVDSIVARSGAYFRSTRLLTI